MELPMLPALDYPELFFGLCSPIGTDNHRVYRLISEAINKYSYRTQYFKVTDLMKSIEIVNMTLQDQPVEQRYDSYIKYANRLREIYEFQYALAMLCCAAVRNFRRESSGDPGKYLQHTAYIFDQFKRKEEIDLLRQVYGRLFIVVSIYSDKQRRTEQLIERIASDHAEARPAETHVTLARALVSRDESEEGEPNGQRLQEAFPSADLFIDLDDLDGAAKLIDRFLEAFFGSNAISPTREEYGMYLARNSALRSLDLSRQVGAAIFSEAGEVITLGCNEVPKAQGGTYWIGDPGDARDFRKGFDYNERIKRSLLVDFTRRLKEGGFLKEEGKELDVARFIIKET